MNSKFIPRRLGQWLLVAALLGFGLAFAQGEPSMSQIYATAQAGKLDEAQVMVQQVLVSHPNSSKAHFVRAELYARQGDLARAGESLSQAEKFSPGLAFAKPEAVQALRTQIASKNATRATTNSPVARTTPGVGASGSSWVLPLLLAGGVMVVGYFVFRRKSPQSVAQAPVYANAYPNGGLSGPQNFGMSGGGAMPMQGSGLGGRIMGGVATGLAVGAGVMAAQAIGRNLMGDHNANSAQPDNLGGGNYPPSNSNSDMGGANFGVNDSGSWDEAGSADVGGGGDWDN
jgi:hypothetical protein